MFSSKKHFKLIQLQLVLLPLVLLFSINLKAQTGKLNKSVEQGNTSYILDKQKLNSQLGQIKEVIDSLTTALDAMEQQEDTVSQEQESVPAQETENKEF